MWIVTNFRNELRRKIKEAELKEIKEFFDSLWLLGDLAAMIAEEVKNELARREVYI